MKIGYARQGETKELRWTKRAKKIEKHAQMEHIGAGIVGSQRTETSPSVERCRGRGSLSAFDVQRVQL